MEKTKDEVKSDQDIKNVRLHIPIDLYQNVKKYQAKVFLDEGKEQSIDRTCVELLEYAINRKGVSTKNKLPGKGT